MNTFSVSQENLPLTKATQSVADYTAVKSITLAFFNPDGTEHYKSTLLRPDATTYNTFGTFSLSLPYGSYKMCVIAREGSLYSSTGNASFQVETTFEDDYHMEF
ncbi:MAG: hypothetical protein J6L98_01240 [Bacteroidales bacterium]|nr:hypothetical protein [Bacteroidales bacterium]